MEFFILFVLGIIGYTTLSTRITSIERTLRNGSPIVPTSSPIPQTSGANTTSTQQGVMSDMGDGSQMLPIGDKEPQFTQNRPTFAPLDITPSSENFEVKLGGKLFTGVGVTALILAAGFFFQYAFKNGWITEGMLIAFGVVVGLVLLGIGEFLAGKYPLYGTMLSGGGIGILFISFFSGGPNVYNLYPSIIALFAVGATSIVGSILAVRHNSFPLSAFALVGGFAAPLMLASDQTDPNLIFPYLIFMDVFALWIERKTLWRTTSIVAYIGTVIVSTIWVTAYFHSEQLMTGEIYSTILFLLFFVVMLLPRFSAGSAYGDRDGFLAVANGGWYFGMSYIMMTSLMAEVRGLFVAAVGVVYGITAMVLGRGNEQAKKLMEICLIMSFLFFATAIWVVWGGAVVTVLWAILATALALMALQLFAPSLMVFGQILFIASLARFLTYNLYISSSAVPLFNDRMGVGLALAICSLIVMIAYKNYVQNHGELAGDVARIPSVFLFEGYAALFFALTWETQQFFSDWTMTIAWGALGLIGIGVGLLFVDRLARVAGYITLALLMVRLFVSHAGLPAGYVPIFNERVALFLFGAIVIAAGAFLVRLAKDTVPKSERGGVFSSAFFAIQILLLYVVSVETLDYFNTRAYSGGAYQDFENAKQVALSVAWIVYGMILLGIGITARSSVARQTSLGLIAVVIIKVFLIDVASLSTLYRFFSFAILGVLLVLAGYLYNRYRERISEFLSSGRNPVGHLAKSSP
ncbi:MAG: DUF2339 domain-containing protein [Minisyncoccota bacterium]